MNMTKNNINKYIGLLLLILLVLLGLPVNSYSETGDLGEPASSFELGSAKRLEGRNVIVCFYVDTPESSWKTSEIDSTVKDMKTACEYIEDTASKYGIETSFEYDWSLGGKNRCLYHRAKIPFLTDETDASDALMGEYIEKWVSYLPSFDAVKEAYNADNVFFIVFLSQEGRSYSLVYDGEDSVNESIEIYKGENPSSIAHEILHLFGAHDYYEGAEYTEDVVSYIKKKYPNEIMLTTQMGKGKIPQMVSDITAYHLGWIDSVDELKDFPQLTR